MAFVAINVNGYLPSDKMPIVSVKIYTLDNGERFVSLQLDKDNADLLVTFPFRDYRTLEYMRSLVQVVTDAANDLERQLSERDPQQTEAIAEANAAEEAKNNEILNML